MLLFENEYVRLDHDPARHLVTFARTATPLPAAVDPGEGLARLRLALLPIDRARSSLLIDMRKPQIRNDDVMENVTVAFQDMVRGFKKSAVLVKTAIGVLQASRTVREGHTTSRTFTDEAEAIRYLTT